MDGKSVEVHIPSQSRVDIQTSKEERTPSGGTAGQVVGTVQATVVAVDTLTNRVKVQTQAGQVIELDTPTTDRQIGEQFTLLVPRECPRHSARRTAVTGEPQRQMSFHVGPFTREDAIEHGVTYRAVAAGAVMADHAILLGT